MTLQGKSSLSLSLQSVDQCYEERDVTTTLFFSRAFFSVDESFLLLHVYVNFVSTGDSCTC